MNSKKYQIVFFSIKVSVIIACCTFILNACASYSDEPLRGASWVALQDIPYPPRRTTVLIQNGSIVERINRRDRFIPFCSIESTKDRNQPLTIKEGSTFNIVSVSYPTNAFDETTIIFETRMQVVSTDHPEIRRILCQVWGRQGGRHMSSEMMENTMNGLLTLEY